MHNDKITEQILLVALILCCRNNQDNNPTQEESLLVIVDKTCHLIQKFLPLQHATM